MPGERLNLVPAGFMRNITQSRVEQRAQEASLTTINLDFAAQVIEEGRSLDNEVLGTYYQQGEGTAERERRAIKRKRRECKIKP